MIKDTQILCSCLGGSHLYGLNTPKSDEDIRGIYFLEDIGDIIGLNSNKDFHVEDKKDGKDIEFKEIRNAMRLLSGSNTQIVELLFNENWIKITSEWQIIQGLKSHLICPDNLFKCLRGYIQGELRLALGERTGKLGSKRKEAIDKYGFSPKNFVQIMRLCTCGIVFYKTGQFPVSMVGQPIHYTLIDIKTNPEKYNKDTLRQNCLDLESDLVKAYAEKITDSYSFSKDIANAVIHGIYYDRMKI